MRKYKQAAVVGTREMIHNPRVLILDEPNAGLGVAARERSGGMGRCCGAAPARPPGPPPLGSRAQRNQAQDPVGFMSTDGM